jgi:hypothetical protein
MLSGYFSLNPSTSLTEILLAIGQVASGSGDKTVLSGQRMAADSAIKSTPATRMISEAAFWA